MKRRKVREEEKENRWKQEVRERLTQGGKRWKRREEMKSKEEESKERSMKQEKRMREEMVEERKEEEMREVMEGREMKREDRRSIFALDWLFSIQVQGVSHFNN